MKRLKDSLAYIQHQYYNVMKVLVFLAAIVFVVWQMPRSGKFKYEFQKMKPWQQETLFAPFDFPIYKDEMQLRNEYINVLQNVYPMFVFNESVTNSRRQELLQNFESAWQEKDNNTNYSKEMNLSFLTFLFDTVQNQGILTYNKVLENKAPDTRITVVRERIPHDMTIQNVFTIKTASDFAVSFVNQADSVVYDKELIKNLLFDAFSQNLVFNASMTKQAEEQAVKGISQTHGMVQKDELIINSGEIVDDAKYVVLNSLRKEYEQRIGTLARQNTLFIGQVLLIVLIFSILFLYLKLIDKEIFDDLRKVCMVLVLMLLMIIPSFWILKFNSNLIILMPLCLFPMIVLTFFNARNAVLINLPTVLIIGLVVPNPFQFLFMQLLISFIVVFSLTNRQRRTSYFKTSLLIFLAYTIVYVGFNLIQEGNLLSVEPHIIGLYGMNALFTMLAIPLIYFFERIFGFVTDLTLLELSNTNSPLLRRMSSAAPGTFQHAMQVANLLEEVVYAIGGNTLLARTGALYHDIGKIENPLFFTENQSEGFDPHESLSNVESAQIIIAHVIKGIELAHKARIPEQVIDFIRTHHGNRRAEYFYYMEKKQNPDVSIDERDFSYHGPIPFSKETAALMMVDSVEAASRSIKEPNEQKINDLVENIINKQIETKQFVNTDITFSDITIIKKVLKKKLMNSFHVRIAYPS